MTVQITCAGDVAAFNQDRKNSFISTLANALGLPQSSVKVCVLLSRLFLRSRLLQFLSVKAASVIVDVRLYAGNGITAKAAGGNEIASMFTTHAKIIIPPTPPSLSTQYFQRISRA